MLRDVRIRSACARGGAAPRDRGRAQLGKLRSKIGRVDLEQGLRIGKTRERVTAEDPERNARGLISLERVATRRREQDLPAVSGGAHTSRGMHCDANVTGLGERRAAGMDADANADPLSVRPLPLRDRPLYRHRRVECARGLTEDGEELVRARVDLVATGSANALADQRPHVTQHSRVSITEPLRETRRAFDVGEKERHRAARQDRYVTCARLDLVLLALLAQLSIEEADRDDAVLLRRPEQTLACSLAGDIVDERGLVEPRKGVPHVRRVVDRQTPASLRVDVREGAVGEARACAGGELWQRSWTP